MDFDSMVNMPVFDLFGVDATITYGADQTLELRAVDKTRGVEIEDQNVGIISTRPVAAIASSPAAHSGRLTRKMLRQPNPAISTPPTTGPAAIEIAPAAVHNPTARARRRSPPSFRCRTCSGTRPTFAR